MVESVEPLEPGPDVLPEVIPSQFEWRLVRREPRKPDVGELRRYYQTELTLDGEVYLIGVVQKAARVLLDNGITSAEFTELELDNGELNWPKVLEMVTRVAQLAPALMAECAAIVLGYYPTREDGTRDPEYDPTCLWLRYAINIPRWTLMAEVFLAQNDYRRLAGPFVAALNRGMDLSNRIGAARELKEAMQEPQPPTSDAPESGTSPLGSTSSPDTDTGVRVSNAAP